MEGKSDVVYIARCDCSCIVRSRSIDFINYWDTGNFGVDYTRLLKENLFILVLRAFIWTQLCGGHLKSGEKLLPLLSQR